MRVGSFGCLAHVVVGCRCFWVHWRSCGAAVGGFLFFFCPCEGFFLRLCVVSVVVMEARTGAEIALLVADGALGVPTRQYALEVP